MLCKKTRNIQAPMNQVNMSCDEEKKIESVQEDNIARSREESFQNICEQSLTFNSNDSDKEFMEDIEADEIDKSPKMFIENEKIVIREGDSSSMMSEKIDGQNSDILKKEINEIDFKNDINTPQEIIVVNFVSDSMSNNDRMTENKYIHKEVVDIDKINNFDESLKIIGDDSVSELMKGTNILVTKNKSFSELHDSGRTNISDCEHTIKLYQENVIGESLELIDNDSPSESMEKDNILNDEEKFFSGIEDAENDISECDGDTKIDEENDISECHENIGNSMSDFVEKDDILNNEKKCFSVTKLDGINDPNESQKMIVDNIQVTMDESFSEEVDFEGDDISDCEDISQTLENTFDNMSEKESDETSQMKKVLNDIDLLIQDSKIDDNVPSVSNTASQGSLLSESIDSGEVDLKKDEENSVQQKMKWRSAKVLMLRSSYMKGHKYDEEELGLPAITYIDSVPNDIVPISTLLESYLEKNKEISLEIFDFLIISPFDAMINEFLSPSAVYHGEIGVVGKRIKSYHLMKKQEVIILDIKTNVIRLREKYPNLKIICMLPHPIKYSKIDFEICVNNIDKFKSCVTVNQYCWLSLLNRDFIRYNIPFISLMSIVVQFEGNWKLKWEEKINSDCVGLGFPKKLEAKIWNDIKDLWEMSEEDIKKINLNLYIKSKMRKPEEMVLFFYEEKKREHFKREVVVEDKKREQFLKMKEKELMKLGFRSQISRLIPIYYFYCHKAIAGREKNCQILTENEKQSVAEEGTSSDRKTTKSEQDDQEVREAFGTEKLASSKRKRIEFTQYDRDLNQKKKNTSARQPISSRITLPPYGKHSLESGNVYGQIQNSNHSNIHNSTQSHIPPLMDVTFDDNLSGFKHEPGLYRHNFAVNPPVSNFPFPPSIGNFSGPQLASNFSDPQSIGNFSGPLMFFDGNLSGFKHEPGLCRHSFAVNPPVGNFPGPPPIGNFSGPQLAGNFSDPQSIGNFSGPPPIVNFSGPQSIGDFPGPHPVGNFPSPQPVGNFTSLQPTGIFAHSSQDPTQNRLNTAPQNQAPLQSHSDVNSSNPGIPPRTNQNIFNSNKQSRHNFQTANQRTNQSDGDSVVHFPSSQSRSGNYRPRKTQVEYSPLHALNMMCEAKVHLGYLGNDIMNIRDDTSKMELRKENSMKLFREIDRNSLVQMCFGRLKKASSSGLAGFDQLLVDTALKACKRLIEEINKL